eukprot:scaffold3006_cov111-Isochrysis_galbana.AAC.7
MSAPRAQPALCERRFAGGRVVPQHTGAADAREVAGVALGLELLFGARRRGRCSSRDAPHPNEGEGAAAPARTGELCGDAFLGIGCHHILQLRTRHAQS